jgi:hypothetical protein
MDAINTIGINTIHANTASPNESVSALIHLIANTIDSVVHINIISVISSVVIFSYVIVGGNLKMII